jgi:hypothetical protein
LSCNFELGGCKFSSAKHARVNAQVAGARLTLARKQRIGKILKNCSHRSRTNHPIWNPESNRPSINEQVEAGRRQKSNENSHSNHEQFNAKPP